MKGLSLEDISAATLGTPRSADMRLTVTRFKEVDSIGPGLGSLTLVFGRIEFDWAFFPSSEEISVCKKRRGTATLESFSLLSVLVEVRLLLLGVTKVLLASVALFVSLDDKVFGDHEDDDDE